MTSPWLRRTSEAPVDEPVEHDAPGPEPLVARERETSRLASALTAGRSVLVVGEAGTGKTALVTGALATLDGAPVSPRVVTVHATSPDQRDLRQALAPLVRRAHGPAGGDLTDALLLAAGPERLVVRIEDAHLLDDESRRLVGWWIRESEFTVIATLRRSAALQWPWMELWRNRTAERIDTAAFGRDEVQTYLEQTLGGVVAAAVGWRLWIATAGVPERVASLTQQERRAGGLSRIDGVWHWRGEPRPDNRLQEVVDGDLASLDPQARAMLELVAVLAPVPFALLGDLGPAAALEELRQRGLVTTASPVDGPLAGRLVASLMHPLYAETIRRGLSPERSNRLFAQLEHLLDDPGLPADLHAGLVAFGLRSRIRVAEPMIRRAIGHGFRTSLGESQVTVIDDALRLGVGEHLQAELLMYRSLAMRRQGEVGRAARDLDQVDAIVASLGDVPELRARASSARAALVHFARDDADGALTLLARTETEAREAVAAGSLAASLADEIEVLHLGQALWAGRRGTYLTRALELLESAPVRAHVLTLLAPVMLSMAQGGRPDAALGLVTRHGPALRAFAEELPLAPVSVAAIIMPVSSWAGRYGDELAFDREATGDPDGAVGNFVRGFLAVTQGVWSVAEAELHAYDVSLQERDPAGLRCYVSALHLLAAAAAGDLAHARDLVERSRTTPIGRWGVLEGEMRLLRLDAAIWAGEPEAPGQAADLARWARERQEHRVELEVLHRQCLLAGRDATPRSQAATVPVLERIRTLAPVVDGRRNAALVAHAEALVAGDLQMAEVHERELAACGLWLAPVRSAPVASLTHREREIANMAAGGMSSRAIAERLVLSVRTVDTHLARAYAKLSVHSREELSRALRRRG